MTKGIIYIMTTAVSGLIKIGKTGNVQYKERMRHLETNGYHNVTGLKIFFAIELKDYDEKETLLQEIFSRHRVANSELFYLDMNLAKQLLLAFEGKVIFPSETNKEKDFGKITKIRKQGELFSFYKKGLKNGDIITFTHDKSITAKIVGEREVEYGGQIFKLSPLVYKIFEQKGQLNTSGAYQGAQYFMFNGAKLKDLPDCT